MDTFKYVGTARKTKDGKKLMVNLEGRTFLIAPTTDLDAVYGGIYAPFKVTEIIKAPKEAVKADAKVEEAPKAKKTTKKKTTKKASKKDTTIDAEQL